MALLNQAILVPGQLGKFFETLRGGQAPEKVTRQFLKDIGFSSSNHLAFIPLLKGLGFLTADGSPTTRYREMLDPTRWRNVLAEAIREAYGDIFVLKTKPTKADKAMILGKYKSTYNMSETTADRAASTFLALVDLAGEEALYPPREGGLHHQPLHRRHRLLLLRHQQPRPQANQKDRFASRLASTTTSRSTCPRQRT